MRPVRAQTMFVCIGLNLAVQYICGRPSQILCPPLCMHNGDLLLTAKSI